MGMPRVRMADGAADLIGEECSRHPDTETGGVLLGYCDASSPDNLLHVVAATGPGPNASHRPGLSHLTVTTATGECACSARPTIVCAMVASGTNTKVAAYAKRASRCPAHQILAHAALGYGCPGQHA